ncbi:methionyl-tRNA formyltransferase [Homoserinibacter sp. GY 40078]|uniref:methionyl-tRNA formyltransferase n=1 Tax=Homoserinibacter sp. GY 40078 TaxID=2603275 RepID=UPI0011CADF15|nr:methionyl-tRNA formyltransferase [Homoserinibacter sp. GY 40078]TXK17552.1 methionyl-tRNA formyltransferase [Homoserinibacter sp. GY 40078]
MTPLRILFAGSPAAAVPSLRELLASPHEVVGVVTREDAPLGRKRVLTPTPVAQLGEEAGVPVLKANRLAPVQDELMALGADLGVIVAYGGLIREPLLSAPTHGWINLHFSLLPRWRGAAPVQRAIMAGDDETGAAVFQLVEELDAGPVFAIERASIGRVQTAGHLLDALSESGARLLRSVVDGIADGSARATPQTGDPTLAPKLTLMDGRIDWQSPRARIDALIRGVTPEPGATTELEGERFKIHAAAMAHDAPTLPPGHVASRGRSVHVGTGDAPLELLTVQPAGKRPMPAIDWWRGRPSDAPTVFG